MIVYTLREYFILKQYFFKEKIVELSDNYQEYKLGINKKNQHHKHDKLFRDILSNKKEVVRLVNKYIKPKEAITEEMIERYDTKFITNSYEEKESDILFKLKNKEVFFLLEHQTKVDKLMASRITEYCIEIIRTRRKENFLNNSDKMIVPIVIPLVLYTGQAKWTAKNKLEEVQVKFEHLKGVDVITGYNLIDIRDEGEAIKDGTALARMSVIERKNNTEDIIEAIKRMSKYINDREERKEFAKEVNYLLSDKLTKEEIKKIEEILLEREGEEGMLHAQMVIERDFKKAREEGREEGRKEGMLHAQMVIARDFKRAREEGREEGRKEGMLHAQMVIERDFKKAREEGREEGRKEGMLHAQMVIERDFKKAREEERKKGEVQKAINIAKKMLDEKIDIDLISKITGLKKEQFMK